MGAAKSLGNSISSGVKGIGSGASILGIDSGSAPKGVPLATVATAQDVQNAQGGVNNSLESQQALLAALKNQNGLGAQNTALDQQQQLANALAQSNGVANQAGAMNQQQALNSQLAASNGIGTQNQAISGLAGLAGRQQGTESMYQNIAEGRGPNPAQAMLNQQTGANVANQAALMAGQRGAGANVGLMARQAAQQGAATQQQAVGQGATMQANQQLNALSGLTAQQQAQAGTQQALGGLGTTQAGMQQAGISNQAQQAQAQIAAQQSAQQAAAQQANVVAGQQIANTTTNTQANLQNAQQQQNALGAMNNANVNMQGNINTGNTALANTSLQGRQGLTGGLIGGAGALIGAAGGGEIVKMADGGSAIAPAPLPVAPVAAPPPGPSSSFGTFLKGWGAGTAGKEDSEKSAFSNMGNDSSGGAALNKGASNFGKGVANRMNKETPVEVASSQALPANNAANMGSFDTANAAMGGLASRGGPVNAEKPGQKAVKGGNSYSNDKIPAMLSEHEIVLPREITMSKDPIRASADFVAKVLAKRKVK